MEWKTGIPEKDGLYLVCEIRTYKENSWLDYKLLLWNSYYHCWDDEGEDDFYCKPEKVYSWMPLPEKPEFKQDVDKR